MSRGSRHRKIPPSTSLFWRDRLFQDRQGVNPAICPAKMAGLEATTGKRVLKYIFDVFEEPPADVGGTQTPTLT